ncbi:amidohydrolase family protein [Roseivirga thermotolerans]|uniref:Amidohydrolase n=1 Tax=Roseivirga thermotolerans TaxID=1758176 RepID=A0ABQ3I5J4_9BACT|nr:amidohydrolase family protein [Roseivirga thermotolerans]GHE56395.1 amidohydrolase [Roseivirga thermotolerans]
MKKLFLSLALLLLGMLPTSCQNAPEADFAFTNVNIVDVEGGQILANQTVFIKDGKISLIVPSNEARLANTQTVRPGEGGYLMPGLAEMHAHIPGNQNMRLLEETLFLYLSNGITTIRGMLGQPYHLELKEKVATGEILGPRIYTSGPSLNGNSVTSVQQAEQMVRDQKKAGYDFMKLHPGLTLENFNAIVKTAKEVNMPFAGHVSIDVGIRNTLKAQYASIDHVDGYIEGLVPSSIRVNPNANGFFGLNFTKIADENLLDELVQLTVENEVWIVPTQAMMERWVGPEAPETLAQETEMKYMSPSTVDNWVRTKKQIIESPAYDAEQALQFNTLRRKIIQKLHAAGVGILLGSDAPQVFNVPGFSIQLELDAMVRSGMSPLEAIRAGTLNPALFFKAPHEFGAIKEGASADLILVRKNPLDNIAHLQDRAGVMVRGKWLSRQEIDNRLKEIAKNYGH